MKQTAVEWLAETLRFANKELYAEMYEHIEQPFSVTFSYKEEYVTVKLDNGEDVLKLAQIFSDMLSNNNIPNKIIKEQ